MPKGRKSKMQAGGVLNVDRAGIYDLRFTRSIPSSCHRSNCDESLFWMEILVETGKVKASLLADLVNEGSQILAIVVASAKTARSSRPA